MIHGREFPQKTHICSRTSRQPSSAPPPQTTRRWSASQLAGEPGYAGAAVPADATPQSQSASLAVEQSAAEALVVPTTKLEGELRSQFQKVRKGFVVAAGRREEADGRLFFLCIGERVEGI